MSLGFRPLSSPEGNTPPGLPRALGKRGGGFRVEVVELRVQDLRFRG